VVVSSSLKWEWFYLLCQVRGHFVKLNELVYSVEIFNILTSMQELSKV
jgi:hypothetical protein